MGKKSISHTPLVGREFIVVYCMITTLFALWGFANDITNPMVSAFKSILLVSNFESSLVQFAFYGGYCLMAVPAAILVTKTSYKLGILFGLGIYSIGCFLFVPAADMQEFKLFLLAYFVMTCGLSFLETSANPYILSLGHPASATRRLNLAQAFNPAGSLFGMLVAQHAILAKLSRSTDEERAALRMTEPEKFSSLVGRDLGVLVTPYVALGIVVFLVFAIFFFKDVPNQSEGMRHSLSVRQTLQRLIANRSYLEGVVAQAFYVGVQIMCWTFVIQYAEEELGMSKADAQGYNIVAMSIFVCSRFVCTCLLKFVSPGRLLFYLAMGGGVLILGVVLLQGMLGLYCLIGVSGCMSLMFPTIYGIALSGLGEDSKLGAAGLILAIGGGSFLPPLQGANVDLNLSAPLSSIRLSFLLSFLCFVVIAIYGYRTFLRSALAGLTDS
ncbi:L-fucose:H+ symporter permease [Pelagicoccus sp. SDUM812002]|uniref:L-fucose:H+ symporter permease n=1 Tax=Pelagicoccus sp. SDUM812002 TaxID=3041266 RepID=UPI00280CE10E|nr:L-fucose:H+ symporter permease [Pelagicoccus sp. SDUM812002]